MIRITSMNIFSRIPKPIIPILFINFVSTLSFSIVLPFLYILVGKYGGNSFSYGILTATYSLFQLIGSPLLGSWSDKFGRKPILLLSQFGTFISWIIFLFAFFLDQISVITINNGILGVLTITFPLLAIFLARAIDGITGANVSVANAYLADISSSDSRTKNFGLMSVSANLGFIIGPALAGLLGETNLGLLLPIIVACLISLLGLILILVLLKPQKIQKETINQQLKAKSDSSFKKMMSIPHFKLILWMNFLIFLGFNFFYVSFPVFIIADLGWSEFELGFLLSFLSICMVLVQGPGLSKISNKISTNTLMISGSIILSLGFVILIFKELIILYLSMALIAIGNGFLYPSLVATLSDHAGDDLQGAAQGYITSVGSLASILGLLIGGVLYEIIQADLFIVSGITFLILMFLCIQLRILEKYHDLDKKCIHGFINKTQPVIESCDPFVLSKKFKKVDN